MAEYTLTYFDSRGLAELPRLIFTAAGQEFKDERVPIVIENGYPRPASAEQWAERKQTAPFGQLPVLTLADGTQIAQSSAIVRFVAARMGMAGSGDVETALVDAAFEHVSDIRRAFFTAKADAEKLKAFWDTDFAAKIAHMEKNIQGETFIAKSNKLSYADIALYYLRFVFLTENAEATEAAFKANPRCAAIADAVEKNEKVAAYIAQRKQTMF